MLKVLRTLFKQNTEKHDPTEQELKLAAATLMFEVIRSDGRIDQIELTYMRNILRQEFALEETELEELFELAKEKADEATSLQGFTRDICNIWGQFEREKLLKYLWMLALADKQVDPHERHLVRKVAGL